MDRISKLFGKKSESDQAAAGIEDTDKIPVAPDQKAMEPFGLKFVLSDGHEFLFTSLPITIGRSPGNALMIDHDTVSADHALVYFDEQIQDVCIVDRDSLNGILIDMLPTRRNVLHDGVKISLGEVVLQFRDTGYIHTIA